MSHTTVIYEGTPGHRLHTPHLEVVGIADGDLEHALELIADYKRDFAAGNPRPAAFLFPAVDATEPIDHPDVMIMPVHDRAHAEQIGARFAADGVGMVELYGGLGPAAAAAILRGADGTVPVGFVDP